ncbi:5-deoxy-glucuronate isomerase [Streptomyces sp. NPDC057249]|uniref:5-deoxy-glucuronate isomerase n=1 Tax=Streptomyces sp. NPDC057249 TaxID=3346067 RepID=UPI00363A6C79
MSGTPTMSIEDLGDGDRLTVGAADREHVVVVQRGRVVVEQTAPTGTRRTELGGRADVFDGRASAVIVPAGRRVDLIGAGAAQVAVVSAPSADKGEESALVRPDDVAVESRGRGHWAREVHDIVTGRGTGPHLVVGETFSRGGVWSSYPPHRHAKDDSPDETRHAEVFHVRVEPPTGFAVFLDYPDDTRPENARVVHDGDIVDGVEGFHSFACAGGHELYYLWALWGQEPTARFRTDARHAWIEGTP